jgi:ACS family tartrate transporter-like MFS transporter
VHVLEDQQPGHQPRRQRRLPWADATDQTEASGQELPVNLRRQTDQRVAKIDNLFQRRAKQIVLTIVARLAHGFPPTANKAGTASHSVWRGLADLRVIALSLVYFGTSAGLYTLGIWAPQIIKEFGLSSLQVGFLNALPGIVAIVAMVQWARHSDRSGERTWHVVGACMLACLGLVLAGFAGTVLAVLLALTLVNIGISSAKPPLWSMPTMFLSGSAAAAGIATINSIGNLGGFVGPAMIGWIKDLTGSFQGGLFFVAGLLVLSAVLTLVLARSQRTSAATAAGALPTIIP